MEKLLFAIVILLALILIILLVVLCVFFYRYLKLKESQLNEAEIPAQKEFSKKIPQEVQQKIDQAKLAKAKLEGQFCVDHSEMPAKGICSISNEKYCELCITKERDVRIARKFLHLFLDTNWENSFFLEDKKVGESKLDELMRVKMELWNSDSTPIITQKQFKINIETDQIETYTVVMTRPEDKNLIESRFGFLNE